MRQQLQNPPHFHNPYRVQPVDGLVQHKELRMVKQRDGKSETLAHAEGILRGFLLPVSVNATVCKTSLILALS